MTGDFIHPIGVIRSQYKQRFAIPRQSGLSLVSVSKLVLNKRFSADSVRGLTDFSHLWVLFKFHETKGKAWKEVVRPPRLGGKKGRGVFATRTPFRPNPIGLSAVKILKLYQDTDERGRLVIDVQGGDFLDGTPIFDIKPYVPYADNIPTAQSSWASQEDSRIVVSFNEGDLTSGLSPDERVLLASQSEFIIETLSLDPRPAHERGKNAREGQTWGVVLGDFEVKWTVKGGVAIVVSIEVAD